MLIFGLNAEVLIKHARNANRFISIPQFARAGSTGSTILQIDAGVAGAVQIARASTANVLHCFASRDSTHARELPLL